MNQYFFKDKSNYTEHENTLNKFSRIASEKNIRKVLLGLEKLLSELSDKVCFVHGMGGQTKLLYKSLSNVDGIEVKWYGSLLPNYLKPLNLIISSYKGLIKINESNKLTDVFIKTMNRSMAGVYIFNYDLEDFFVRNISQNSSDLYADQVVKQDPSFFIYQVDADNFESSTGLVEIIYYGKKCPQVLINYINSN